VPVYDKPVSRPLSHRSHCWPALVNSSRQGRSNFLQLPFVHRESRKSLLQKFQVPADRLDVRIQTQNGFQPVAGI
jgi:hypothetical protein